MRNIWSRYWSSFTLAVLVRIVFKSPFALKFTLPPRRLCCRLYASPEKVANRAVSSLAVKEKVGRLTAALIGLQSVVQGTLLARTIHRQNPRPHQHLHLSLIRRVVTASLRTTHAKLSLHNFQSQSSFRQQNRSMLNLALFRAFRCVPCNALRGHCPAFNV